MQRKRCFEHITLLNVSVLIKYEDTSTIGTLGYHNAIGKKHPKLKFFRPVNLHKPFWLKKIIFAQFLQFLSFFFRAACHLPLLICCILYLLEHGITLHSHEFWHLLLSSTQEQIDVMQQLLDDVLQHEQFTYLLKNEEVSENVGNFQFTLWY